MPRSALCVLAAVILFVIGCGGGGNPAHPNTTPSAAPPPTFSSVEWVSTSPSQGSVVAYSDKVALNNVVTQVRYTFVWPADATKDSGAYVACFLSTDVAGKNLVGGSSGGGIPFGRTSGLVTCETSLYTYERDRVSQTLAIVIQIRYIPLFVVGQPVSDEDIQRKGEPQVVPYTLNFQ